jgi:signal transduction histidine kinase
VRAWVWDDRDLARVVQSLGGHAVPPDPRLLVDPVADGPRVIVMLVGTLGIAALALVIAARAHDGSWSADPVGSVNDVLAGSVAIVAGLVGWIRLPRNPTGPLLVAIGFAWWASDLSRGGSSVAWTLGQTLAGLYIAIGVLLLVAFPSGRIVGRAALAIVVGAFIAKVVLQPVQLAFFDPRLHGCPRCPANLLLLHDSTAAHTAITTSLNLVDAAIAIAVALLLAQRWRGSSRAGRRALVPVLAAGGVVALAGIGASMIWLASAQAGHVASRMFALTLALVPLAFLAGLLRAQLARSAVARLVVEVGHDPSPAQLRAAIARALGDPSCQIAYWLPEPQRWADADGRPLELPAQSDERAVTELDHDGQRIAALIHDPALLDDPQLVGAVATAARLGIENSRLQAELHAQLAHVRESRIRILAATDAERRRIERDLHDGMQQYALKALIELDQLRSELAVGDERGLIDAVRGDLDNLVTEIRAVARGLHPAILIDQGLPAAIESLAVRSPIAVTITTMPAERLPAAVEAAAYYTCAEALTNAHKHAHASHVTISAIRESDTLHLEVIDDGRGDARQGTSSGGLRGLADRIEALNGSLRIDSPPGRGTRIEVTLPCA